MTEAVTDVIVARARDAERLQPMVLWSVGAHVVLLLMVVLVPIFSEPAAPPTRMTITLSAGAPGPESGGLTPIGGRPIQQATPSDAPRLLEPAPVPPDPPKMVVPEPEPIPPPRPRPETRKPVVEKPPPAPEAAAAPPVTRPTRTATPSTGEQVREGNTPVETRARGAGFGLSSGGGGAGGSSVQLDVDFCCQEYIDRMVNQIRLNWDQRQSHRGVTWVKFTIRRDGTIDDVRVDGPSGVPDLDRAALRAVAVTDRLPRLPEEFTNPTLSVRLAFEY
jgi:protein TonB